MVWAHSLWKCAGAGGGREGQRVRISKCTVRCSWKCCLGVRCFVLTSWQSFGGLIQQWCLLTFWGVPCCNICVLWLDAEGLGTGGGCSPDRLCEQRQEAGRKLWECVLSVVTVLLCLTLWGGEGKLQSEYLKLPPSASSASVYAFKLLITVIV